MPLEFLWNMNFADALPNIIMSSYRTAEWYMSRIPGFFVSVNRNLHVNGAFCLHYSHAMNAHVYGAFRLYSIDAIGRPRVVRTPEERRAYE